jgi:hypothetical protein
MTNFSDRLGQFNERPRVGIATNLEGNVEEKEKEKAKVCKADTPSKES